MSSLEIIPQDCKSVSAKHCHLLPDFIDFFNTFTRSTIITKNDANDGRISLARTNCKIEDTLNTFLHFVEKHNNNQDFKYITNKLSQCNIQTCVMFRRNYRYRLRLTDQIYGKCAVKYIVNTQIFDKIHCFYKHQFNQNSNNFINQTIQKYNQLQDGIYIHCKDKMYSFGSEFVYGYKDEDKGDYKNYKRIIQKYANLKLEMTQNNIYQLTTQQFNTEYEKARIHLSSSYCKTNFSDITTEHILCLMIYCNYDSLQREFSKTYRENTIEHKEFFHLAKNLKITVRWFGTSMKDGIDKCYHGIGEKLLFPQTIGIDNRGISIYCPLSTSSSLSVAINFCNHNNGLIVEFGGKDSKAKYFSMQFLSDFPSESEMLFIQNYHPMQLNNIIDSKTGYQFDWVLKCLKIIEKITRDKRCNSEELSQCTDLIENIISNQLFKHFPNQFKPFKSLHVYAAE
eukprot:416276_1